MRIANRDIGPGHPCFITAEIGINHNGSLSIAKELIDVAKIAGADAVKFQKRTVEIVYSESELSRPRESPFGNTNGDLKRGLEFGFDEYREIQDYCYGRNILWFASPWDIESVGFLDNLNVPCFKIASACITDLALVSQIAKCEKPIIMSTGMSETDEIDRAVNLIYKESECELALLACTSTYPAKLEELNLSRIATLRELYPECVIGYSGHEVGLYTTLCAVAMGASIVERHITLDRSMFGTDQPASVEPQGFIKLVKEIRDFEKAIGNGNIGPIASELVVREKLRRV